MTVQSARPSAKVLLLCTAAIAVGTGFMALPDQPAATAGGNPSAPAGQLTPSAVSPVPPSQVERDAGLSLQAVSADTVTAVSATAARASVTSGNPASWLLSGEPTITLQTVSISNGSVADSLTNRLAWVLTYAHSPMFKGGSAMNEANLVPDLTKRDCTFFAVVDATTGEKLFFHQTCERIPA
jgi:hypothetical protein